MNIQAIKRACLARMTAVLLTAPDGKQWITSGQSVYPVEGLRLDLDGLEALFDLTEKKRANLYMREGTSDDARLDATDREGDEPAKEAGKLVYLDELFIALETGRGIVYIPEGPIKHVKDDKRFYVVRWHDSGPLVAVFQGLFVEALCVPLGNGDAESINRSATRMGAPRYVWPDRNAEAAVAERAAEAMMKRIEE